MSTWCSKHVEAWNKLIVKQKFCASSWLITKTNILRCTVSKTSKIVYMSAFVCSSQPTRISSTMSTNYLPGSVTFKAVTNTGSWIVPFITNTHSILFCIVRLSRIYLCTIIKPIFNTLRNRTGNPQRWLTRNVVWRHIISTMACLHNQLQLHLNKK